MVIIESPIDKKEHVTDFCEISGMNSDDVCDAIYGKTWGCTPSQVKEYIEKNLIKK